MALFLFLCFVALPFVELAVVVGVAGEIGWGWAFALMVISGVVGAWLCKREGLGILRRMNGALAEGRIPTDELIEGALVLFAGALMLTPGYLTDVAGLLLLAPPIRALARRVLVHRFRNRIDAGRGAAFTFVSVGGRGVASSWGTDGSDEIIDVESWETGPDREQFGRLPEGP